MGLTAPEVIRIASSQNGRLISDGHLQSARENQATFLPLMRDFMFARSGSWLVALLDELDRLVVQVRPNLQERYATVGDLGKLVSTTENPVGRLGLVREELGETQRNTIQHLLQHADGRVQFASLDLRDRGIRNARLARELALRQPVAQPAVTPADAPADAPHRKQGGRGKQRRGPALMRRATLVAC